MNNSSDVTLEEIFLGGKINNSNNLSSKENGEEKFPKLEKPSGASDQIKSYIDRPVMDTSLPYIPVYTHLITFDLEPIERPPTPPN
ncbi:uncharacterized protein LOC130675345 isoform X2 [Microplitis mediator]|uniref:uncharacterized protein LOC130675345 isoform X2 n=1 Tax=Microplitis mediator TaxID=375433 RepID=UPI0025535A82|nr:uncharacterized protein LOC130675345 isoform X2 [Microplitis mediator]